MTLIIVGSFPFILSWYQIKNSQRAIVDQAQKTHLIISKATAERISSTVENFKSQAETLGNNPEVYLQPDAPEVAELLTAYLVSDAGVQAIALSAKQDSNQYDLIQLAQRKDFPDNIRNSMTEQLDQELQLIETASNRLLQVNLLTARPNVYISIVFQLGLAEFMNPQILGEAASLSLFDQQGALIAHSEKNYEAIPEEWLQSIFSGEVTSAAHRVFDNNHNKSIVGFARVEETPWYVISKQPIRFAEESATRMSKTAWSAFAISLAIMSGVILLAYYLWVKPIRRVIKAQHSMMGNKDTMIRGDEVTALESSFNILAQHINDRNSLGEVFVDRYQVINPIGQGGMGTVFLGWDPRLDRYVALKTIPLAEDKAYASREEMSQLLIREAVTAAKISHRNVVSIYDVVYTDTTAFIAMEFIDGESLHSLLKKTGPLTLSETLAVAISTLKGLHVAHKLGFAHRDVKPENILLDQNGDIKLTDFGTTVLVSGSLKDKITGTHGYIAPETYLQGDVGAHSDIFAVGVVIYKCLLGFNPFIGRKPELTRKKVINDMVSFPEAMVEKETKPVFEYILTMLDKDPSKRPASAKDAAIKLAELMPHQIYWNADHLGISRVRRIEESKNESVTVVAAGT